MLCLPKQKQFIAVILKNEDQVLADIVYDYRNAFEYESDVRRMLLDQVKYTAVFDTTTLTQAQLEKV